MFHWRKTNQAVPPEARLPVRWLGGGGEFLEDLCAELRALSIKSDAANLRLGRGGFVWDEGRNSFPLGFEVVARKCLSASDVRCGPPECVMLTWLYG
jgi:hypothetical protein